MASDILRDPPKMDYFEELPECDEKNFDQVIRARRSVRVFEETPVPKEVIEKALEHALLAPNSSNLQPWHFVWVNSTEGKEALTKACLSQSAARTAREFIIIIARTKTWPKIQKEMIAKLKSEGAPASALTYYEKIVPIAYGQGPFGILGPLKKLLLFFRGLSQPTPRGPASLADMRVWAHKTAALACENIMLSLVSQGHDSCPMEGFDENLIRSFVPKNILGRSDEVCMVLGIGKRKEGGIFGPQVRMEKEKFITKI